MMEHVEHGNPSGVDNFVAVHGGIVKFNNSQSPHFLRLPESSMHFIQGQLYFGIVDSGIKKNTRTAVALVREKCQSNSKCTQKVT